MKKLIPMTLLVILFAVFSSGCTLINPVATIGCTEFSLRADQGIHDVVNTLTGEEATYFRVKDGAGNLLYYGLADQGTVVSSVTPIFDSDTLTSYTTPPQYNPITLEVLDPPGGPLASEVVFYTFSGTCPGLPEYVSDDYQKIGQVRVTAPGVALYQDPAGDVVRDASLNEIWIPNQTADNPYEDIYDVIDQTTVGSTTWISIFTGNVNYPVWIPVGGPVQILTLAE